MAALETIRPFHTAAKRSPLLATRSRLRIAYSRKSKTDVEGDQRPVAPQLAPRRIEREILKEVKQCTAPPGGNESTTAAC
jgi:hypothetical protein